MATHTATFRVQIHAELTHPSQRFTKVNGLFKVHTNTLGVAAGGIAGTQSPKSSGE